MQAYIFEISNLYGLSVAVILAETEKQAWELLRDSHDPLDTQSYIWHLKEVKPVQPSVLFKDWE